MEISTLKHQRILSAVKALFFCAAILIFLSTFRSYPYYSWYVGLGFSAISLVIGYCRLQSGYALLGFSCCFLPFFGSGEVNCVMTSFLLGMELGQITSPTYNHLPRRFFNLLLPIISLYFLAGINSLINYSNWVVLFDIWNAAGLRATYRYLSINPVLEQRVLVEMIGIFIALELLKISAQSKTALVYYISGVALGFFISSIWAISQIADVDVFFKLNLSQFWVEMHRAAGTFTDPNAFAMMGLLVLPLFFIFGKTAETNWNRRLWWGIFIFSSLTLLISGSRTLVLGICCWIALLFFMHYRRNRIAWFLLPISALFVAVLSYPPVNDTLVDLLPFSTSDRFLHSINYHNLPQILSSRVVFWQLAIAAFLESPLTGLGLDRFLEEQDRLIATTGVNLGSWRDSANNYYLGVAAESGILGCVLLGIALFVIIKRIRISWRANSPMFVTTAATLMVFLAMLITGSHLYFDEVRYTVFILLGYLLSGSVINLSSDVPDHAKSSQEDNTHAISISLYLSAICSFVFLLSIIFIYFRKDYREQGFYPTELSGSEQLRWSTANASLWLRFEKDKESQLAIRSLHPDISASPVTVRAEVQNKQIAELDLRDSSWHVLRFAPSALGCLPVRINIGRLWSPSQYQTGWVDRRYFGIQVRWTDNICKGE